MNTPQIHLALNHVPVLGAAFAMVALGAGLWARHGALVRFGLFILVAIALAAIPVYFSGEGSEEAIEHLAGVQRSAIEPHEDLARAATLGLAALGLGALAALIRYRRRPVPPRVRWALLLAAIALGGVLARTAHLGGQIRHAELRSAGATAASPEKAGAEHDRE
jgi:uncharacterized membrane protein